MGLVAFSPIDALFAPQGEGGGKQSANGLSGEFTDLLAALLGSPTGEPAELAAGHAGRKESAHDLVALLTAGRGKAEDEITGMPDMAALVASLLHPAAPPAIPSIVVTRSEEPAAPAVAGAVSTTAPSATAAEWLAAPTAGEAHPEVLAVGTPSAETAPAAGDAPASEAVDTASGQAGSAPLPSPATAEVTPQASSATFGGPAPTENTAAVQTVVQAAPATGEAPTAPATGQVDPPPPDDGTGEVKAHDGPGPAEPPETVTLQSGVVRFVGNAQKGKHEGQQDMPGRPDHERGVPRASAQGIAHASDNSAVAQLRTPAPDAPPVDQVPPAPPPAEQPQPVEQVARAVIEKIDEGGGEAHIRLDPPELGQVTIHVKISGDHVRIDVHAERAETLQMLRDHALDLTSLLGGRGLDLTDVYVGLGGRQAPDARGDEGPGGRPRQGQGDEFRDLLGIEEEPPTSDRYNRLRAAYNPDGTHVYRI